MLTFRDTGIGIGEDDLGHIFEPFYTKKVMGRSGTGLGMAVGILKRLGYRAEACESGENALKYLKQQDVDLVILDMIMAPGIDGLETYNLNCACSRYVFHELKNEGIR